MADSTTIARPYAKAIFEYGLAVNKLALWSQALYVLAQGVADRQMSRFITNPRVTNEQKSSIFDSLLEKALSSDVPDSARNLVQLLTENKRLALLPDIYAQYEALRAEYEKTIEVGVKSFTPMTEAQQKRLTEKLTERLSRQVKLNVSIDETLLGGAIIQAGDLVIDGSVRGKLDELDRVLVG